MTFFIRNKSGETIAEVEISDVDLSSIVYIEKYSAELLALSEEYIEWKDWVEEEEKNRLKIQRFIRDFERISKIRGEWFEKEKSLDNYSDIKEFIRVVLGIISVRWGFRLVED